MSISSHLTPEPERRLWLILEHMEHAVESADRRIAAVTAFAMLELAFLKLLTTAGGPLGLLAIMPLALALPLGVFAFSPLSGRPKAPYLPEPRKDKPSVDHCMIWAEDIAKYTHSELVHRFDKYLGGGITATPYHEDIVGQVVVHARIAVRKQRLFRAACVIVGVAQLGVFGQLVWR
ncbi:MAG: hypothetical protein HY926_04635 [Elusimicrobia bacterium]|nr:hypothetical protein [Elusimicrobiota bacterium]